MNKIITKRGFSLAEALITLLIVCLITLASIPVLTKKKRTAEKGPNGIYICTRNSQNQYVYYDQSNASGKIEDPDTWLLTNKESCSFVPPLNARNFSVTLIGGGGGGASAKNQYDKYLEKTEGSGTWIPQDSGLTTGFYDVLVVGGGGGGGGVNEHLNDSRPRKLKKRGPGGGGSGAFIFGNVRLKQDLAYEYGVGSGGTAGKPRWNGGWSDPDNWYRAGSGSESYFRSKNTDTNQMGGVNFKAAGGQGGGGIGCGKDFSFRMTCGGGAGGNGADKPKQAAAEKATGDISVASGTSGANGIGWEKAWAPGAGGENSLPSIASGSGLGNGGNGSDYFNTGSARNGFPGTSGAVIVGKLVREHGGGGHSGNMVNFTLPSIKSVVTMTIAPIAQENQKGGGVYFKLDDNIHKNYEKFADGGEPGVSSVNNTEPKAGDNSPWTGKHGGLAGGKCTNGKAAYYSTDTITIEEEVCIEKECVSSYKENENSTNIIKPYYLKNGVKEYLPERVQAFLEHSNSTTYKLPSNTSSVTLPLVFLKQYLIDVKTLLGAATSTLQKCDVFDDTEEDDKDMATTPKEQIVLNKPYWCRISKSTGCFYDSNGLTYAEDECKKTDTKKRTEYKSVYHPAEPPECPRGGRGTYFGAGGGGGRANDVTPTGGNKGLSGKGGYGAPGAVIIEW